MLNGHLTASDKRNNCFISTIAFICLALSCIPNARSDWIAAQYYGNPNCLYKQAIEGLNFSSQKVTFSEGVTPNLDGSYFNYTDEEVILLCQPPRGQCQLLMEWPCGSSAQTGWYNCSTSYLVSSLIGRTCYEFPGNTYKYFAGSFYLNGELEPHPRPIAVEFVSTTYELPGFQFNLSYCLSDLCITDTDIYNYGQYYLSSNSATCFGCLDFSCCNPPSAKRMVQVLCSLGLTGFNCPVGNCTVLMRNGTTVNEICQPTYPFSQFNLVCTDDGCLLAPNPLSNNTPNVLSTEAFWALLAAAFVLFLLMGAVTYWVICRVACRATLM